MFDVGGYDVRCGGGDEDWATQLLESEEPMQIEIIPTNLSCLWGVYRLNDTILVEVEVFGMLRCVLDAIVSGTGGVRITNVRG